MVAGVVGVAIVLAACWWLYSPPLRVASATITFDRVPSGGGSDFPLRLHVRDQRTLDRLVSFFPHLGQRRWSPFIGLWIRTEEIKFVTSDGRTIRVAVYLSSDSEVWTEGCGDWPVEGNLGAYLAELRRTIPPTTTPARLAPYRRPFWQNIRMGAVAGVPTSTPPASASDFARVVDAYAKKIAAGLPKGWKVTINENFILVTREGPADWIDGIGLSKEDKEEVPEYIPVHFSFRIGLTPPPCEADLPASRAQNARIEREIDAVITKRQRFVSLNPCGIYVPENPEEKEAYTKFQSLQSRWCRLPDVVMPDAAAVFDAVDDDRGALLCNVQGDYFGTFHRDAVDAECRQVWGAVRAVFEPRATSRPTTTASAPAGCR